MIVAVVAVAVGMGVLLARCFHRVGSQDQLLFDARQHRTKGDFPCVSKLSSERDQKSAEWR